MTAINSPIPLPAQPPRANRPGDDFVHRLSHPAAVQSMGPVPSAILAFLTFGLLPLVIWPVRWAEFADSERKDILDLIKWWRMRVYGNTASELDTLANRFRPRPMLMVLPWLVVGFNCFAIGAILLHGENFSRIWDLTYHHATTSHMQHFVRWETNLFPSANQGRYVRSSGEVLDAPPNAVTLEDHLYPAWLGGLLFAYICQWYAVRSHAVSVHALVKWTNKIAKENGFSRIKDDVLKVGLRPVWVILAVAFCFLHAWWAIPMVLAGAMQRRYMSRSSAAVRITLAGQTRDAHEMSQTAGDRFCTANHCGARLPAPARYCPRCGAPA